MGAMPVANVRHAILSMLPAVRRFRTAFNLNTGRVVQEAWLSTSGNRTQGCKKSSGCQEYNQRGAERLLGRGRM